MDQRAGELGGRDRIGPALHVDAQLGLAEVAAYDLAGLAGDPTREFELFSQDSASGKGTPTSGVSASSEATTWG